MRQHYPTASLWYLVERAAAPVVEHNPHLDRVIVAERPRGWRRIAYDAALARQLRRERFDIVIDFHGGPRSAWLTRATGAPRRIGYALPGRFWSYTERVPWTPSLVPPRHSVDNQSDLLRPLGVTAPAGGAPAVQMPVDERAARRVATRLRDAHVSEGDPIAVIHVSASSPFRRWPAERFAQVAATLLDARADLRIIFTAGPSEGGLHDDLTLRTRELAPSHASRVLQIGELDLRELRAVLDRAALYIGGDTGPLHIAATTATPIVALFGPTVPERSMPWRQSQLPTLPVDAGPLPCRPCDQRRCVPGDFRCLSAISVAQVAAAATKLLNHGR